MITAHDFIGGKIFLDKFESEPMRQRLSGQYEEAKVQFLADHLRPEMAFVDAGANKGYFSFIAAKLLQDKGIVWSFEPSPTNFYYLEQGKKLNDYQCIQLFDVALSEFLGIAELHLSEKSGHNSLNWFDGEIGTTVVRTNRLDTIIDGEQVDMIKIDVEGVELEVLKGAEETLLANYDIAVLMDLHPDKGANPIRVCSWLFERGFGIYDMQGNELSPTKNTREILARR